MDGARQSGNRKSHGARERARSSGKETEKLRRLRRATAERVRKGEREGKSRWVRLKGQRSVQGRDKETPIGRVREKKRERGLWKSRRENDGTRRFRRWKRRERE